MVPFQSEIKLMAIVIGVIILGIFMFYPPYLFIPSGWHTAIPPIILNYPWIYLAGRLNPFILFAGLFFLAILFVRGVWKA